MFIVADLVSLIDGDKENLEHRWVSRGLYIVSNYSLDIYFAYQRDFWYVSHMR